MHRLFIPFVPLVAALTGLLAGVPATVLAAEPLATITAQSRETALTYAVEGLVEAVRQSTVSAQIPGRIKEVLFDVGDAVKKGQVLVRIDEAEVGQALAESRAVLAQAEAGFANAKASYERTRQLFAKNFVSQAALDKAEAEFKAAQSQMEARRAGAGIAATTRSYATVVAPYSGVVAARHVELGEMVVPGKPLMTGFDPRDLRVSASIPQYQLNPVRAGILKQPAAAMIEFPSLNKQVTATAVSFQPAADARTHATRVRMELPPGLKDVYPGMFARAHFVIGRGHKLLIPAASVVRRSEVTAVYVVAANGAVQLRQLRLGELSGIDGSEVEVLAGLVAGERVALDPVKAGILLKGARD